MILDDWQTEKVRTALRAHRAYTPGHRRRSMTWLELVAAIEGRTGVAMSDEVPRQFCQGVNLKENPVRYREPEPENLAAIVTYLADPEINALSKDELDQQAFAYQVPVRLLDYLRQAFDAEGLASPPAGLEGRYSAAVAASDTITATVLTLRLDAENGFYRVSETSEIYDHPGEAVLRDWPEQDRRNSFRARKSAEGWAVLTPEDNFLIFLKDRPYGRNHYWTLAADAGLWSGDPVPRLVLSRHEYPAELADSSAIAETRQALSRHFLDNLFAFARIEKE